MIETENIRDEVVKLLSADKSGHSIDHVDRVHSLSLDLAKKENADITTVSLIALLHDVDDYKLFGQENAENLTNAKMILDKYPVDRKIAQHVLKAIPMMGYNNYLDGTRPETVEGMLVSDADMIDAIGSQGIIRTFQYNASKGRLFFDKTIKPVTSDMSAEEYRLANSGHAVQHFFDKLLLIPDIMMTDAGKVESGERSEVMVAFLRELFREENADDWQEHLDIFLSERGM